MGMALAALTMAALAAEAGGGEAAVVPANRAELRLMRKAAAFRQRRVIYNDDGDDALIDNRIGEPGLSTREAFLAGRIAGIEGTQCDAVFYCAHQCFGRCLYNTQVGEVFSTTDRAGQEVGFSKNAIPRLIEEGTDPLAVVVEHCHANGIEAFWSMRVNDTHDAGSAWSSPFQFSQFKKDHPEWLMGTREKRPRHGGWTAVDYTVPEVREFAFRIVEEVCGNYDVDGIEFDFFRHPVLFKRHAMGEAVGQAELDMMTDLFRRVRAMTEAVALEQGRRPILVAVRVPDSLEVCRYIGLDVERWLREDLVDILVMSGYFRLNPWTTSVDLGRKYGVPVYACLSETRVRDAEGAAPRRTLECYRARAMNAWDSGANGVYLFNYFHPESVLWSELGSRETLAPLDKVYTTAARGLGNLRGYIAGGERFLNRPILNPAHPRPLAPGATEQAELLVGEMLPKQNAPRVTLQLRIKGIAAADAVAVAMNGAALDTGLKTGDWLEYAMDAGLVKHGANTIAVTLAEGAEGEVVWDDLLLWMRHGAR
ncbi:MAG: family 10 glycosylhydrolase [Candidatus Hydrogenedentes bacterium]|nr:family 10 glycosylhydrolase [Candidatus Hydrogenedentota bacterium]